MLVKRNKRVNQDRINNDELLIIAAKIVTRYIISGSVPEKEKEDIVMAMIEKFIANQDKIYASFKGESKLSTYVIAVLNRMCCEVIRKEFKHWQNKTPDYISEPITSDNSSAFQLIINDEIVVLRHLFQLMPDGIKFIVFLAYYFRLPCRLNYLASYNINYLKLGLESLLEIKNDQSKADIFIVLANIVNLTEGKDVQSDAVRIWLNKSMEKIIGRLNGTNGRANYDKESFQILFEYFYALN